MKSIWSDGCRIMVCPVCNHTHKDDFKGNTEGEPFIRLAEPLLYEEERDYAPSRILRVPHYACPECGTTQIDLSDV